MPEGIASPKVKIAGTEVEKDALANLVVEQDVDQPDMCSVTVNNTKDYKYSETVKLGDAVVVDIGSTGGEVAGAEAGEQPVPLFEGEVVGLEPIFDVGGETKVVIRAFSKLHRMTRKRHSKTWLNKSDGDIFTEIAQQYSLTPEVKGDVNITHKHVYQHDLTDLEFLHQRARRINYELLMENATKLLFRKRDLSVDSGIELKWGKAGGSSDFSLQIFKPRLSSAGQVNKVTVRGWDSLKSKVIIGTGDTLASKMGGKGGYEAAQTAFGQNTAAYELPIYSQEEADAAAKSLFEDHALNYIVGEGQCKGNPKIKAGMVVKLACEDKRFDGKYYLTGTSHRYSHKSGGPKGGYLTMIRVRRNAQEE
jgi:phage protein D